MKLTLRMKKALIQSLAANVVFMIAFSLIVIIVLLPRVNAVEEIKNELKKTHAAFYKLESKGLDFPALRKVSSKHKLNSDIFTQTLFRAIDAKFYESIFSNDGSKKYLSFLKDLEKETLEIKRSPEYKKLEEGIEVILPTYSTNVHAGAELTDFYFINYVENLLYTFNLESSNEIGVTSLEQVSFDKNGNSQKKEKLNTDSGLYETIYKIGMSFSIRGKKSDIVDFIHFFEHVGALSGESSGIESYNDKFIRKAINGDNWTPNYNIYQKQLADIESLQMAKYPDSSFSPNEKGLISIMKAGEQKNEELQVDMVVNFYVAGEPIYRMKKEITSLIKEFKSFKETLLKDSNTYSAKRRSLNNEISLIQAVDDLKALELLMSLREENIGDLEKSQASDTLIKSNYELVIGYRLELEALKKRHKQLMEILKQIDNDNL